MRKILTCALIVSPLLLLTACSAKKVENEAAPIKAETNIGMANPASVYCVDRKGGKLELKTDPKDGGVYGVCHLPNGTAIEEWKLYYNDHKVAKTTKHAKHHAKHAKHHVVKSAKEEIKSDATVAKDAVKKDVKAVKEDVKQDATKVKEEVKKEVNNTINPK